MARDPATTLDSPGIEVKLQEFGCLKRHPAELPSLPWTAYLQTLVQKRNKCLPFLSHCQSLYDTITSTQVNLNLTSTICTSECIVMSENVRYKTY